MITLAVLGLLALIGGVLAVAVLETLIRRAEVGAGFMLASSVILAYFVDDVPSAFLPGGTRVQVTDVLAGMVLVAGLARLVRLQKLGRWQRWLALLFAVLAVSLARGMTSVGLQTAVNDFRQYLFFVGGALYFATFRPAPALWDRIGKVWLVFAIPMLALVTARWLAVFAGIDLGVPQEKWGNDAAIRVIDGPYTFMLAHAFFLTVPMWLTGQFRQSARWLPWLSGVLGVYVLLLNRRTVWLALLIGVAVVILRDKRLGRRANILIASSAVAAVGLVFVFSNDSGSQLLGQSVSSVGNFSWRVDGWRELLAKWAAEPVNWVVGQPFGSGYTRLVDGAESTAHPHNYYIQTLLRGGVIGGLIMLALTVGLLRALWRGPKRDSGLLGPGVMPALVAMQAVWFLTWVPGVEQGIVTGLAVGMTVSGARAWAEGHPAPAAPVAPVPDPEPRPVAVSRSLSHDRRELA